MQKLYEVLKLVYQLITINVENVVSSLEFLIKFDERLKVTSGAYFIPDFNFLSCEVDNCTFSVLYSVILH